MLMSTVAPMAYGFIPNTSNTTDETKQVIVETVTEAETQIKTKTLTTQERVEEYFKDVPIMIDVARCESQFRQHDANGNALRGIVNSQDVGVMQINEKYHAATALKLGIDIYSLEGNLAYGRYLYETQGTRPWVHSSKCWSKTREVVLR